jgi:hypothetical protein
MADQLATLQDLANALQIALADLPSGTGTLLLECATAVVQQAAGGQRIVQVTGATFNLTGTTDSWLDLPQIPVTAVGTVTLDGVTLTSGTAASASTTYRRVGNRLWRGDGWQTYVGVPSDVAVGGVSHGHAAGSQDLQLARAATLSLAKAGFTNPSAVKSESIDDYNVTYQEMAAQMEASTFVVAALRRKYGRRAGLARLG